MTKGIAADEVSLPQGGQAAPTQRELGESLAVGVPVLLVEDSPLISRSLIDLLEEDGRCRVAHVSDTESDAKAALASQPCRIAVIDLQLREGSGLGVLKFLQHRRDPPLTIVLTNFARPEIRAQCRALGAHHFFDKSREFDHVVPAIRAFLDGTSKR